jgi:hypothetical protein
LKTRPARARPSPGRDLSAAAEAGQGRYRVNLVGGEPQLCERLQRSCRRNPVLSLHCTPSAADDRPGFTARLVSAAVLLGGANPKELRAGAELLLAWGPPHLLPACFLAGCDDYLKDPWTLEELEWRLRRLLPDPRRRYVFHWGSFRLQPLRLLGARGASALSWPEMRILRLLADHPAQVVPREALYYAIWGRDAGGKSRVADVHVSRLRRKLLCLFPESAGALRAVRGQGYLLQ